MHLSALGIFHTIIGIIAIVAAVISFVKKGKIDLSINAGRIYFWTTIVASLTALGISKRGGFNGGHAFALFIVVLVVAAYFLHTKKQTSSRARYFENFSLSFSFFLSLIPTVNETFSRIPLGHPLIKSPADPFLLRSLLVLFVLFLIGSAFQFLRQWKINKQL
jgi:predicted acyltransferase